MHLVALDPSHDVLAKKLDDLVASGKVETESLVRRLRQERIDDVVAPVGPDAGSARPSVFFDPKSKQVGVGFGGKVRRFHPHAAAQFGVKLGVPSAWLRESLAGEPWRRELIADVMETTLQRTAARERLLLRSVGAEVRGVLSDQYRRLDSAVLVGAFADACAAAGAVPYRAHATDTSWSISAVLPQPIGLELDKHGTEFVAACVHVRSSDFGAGPLELSFEILRLLCTNGLIGRSALRQVHLGGRLPDDLVLSQKTFDLDSATQASAVGDVTTKLLEPAYVRGQFARVQAAAKAEVEPEREVDGLVRARRLTPQEGEALEAALMRSNPAEIPAGPTTRWRFAQAVSWLAHGVDRERGAELERLGGSLVME
jgi:hypothetical protein